jgi:RNA polymerase sigma-70 factor (ECF subfamily)
MRNPDPILVARAQQGDREALDDLLRLAQRPLHQYVTGLLADSAAADDVLQETLFRIARKLRWLSRPAAFRAWAFRIASREAHRHLARRGVAWALDEVDGIAVTDPDPLPVADPEELRAAVESLSPSSRAVVALHYWNELPLQEIAEALEIPLGTVKSRLAYGLTQLRARFGSTG